MVFNHIFSHFWIILYDLINSISWSPFNIFHNFENTIYLKGLIHPRYLYYVKQIEMGHIKILKWQNWNKIREKLTENISLGNRYKLSHMIRMSTIIKRAWLIKICEEFYYNCYKKYSLLDNHISLKPFWSILDCWQITINVGTDKAARNVKTPPKQIILAFMVDYQVPNEPAEFFW